MYNRYIASYQQPCGTNKWQSHELTLELLDLEEAGQDKQDETKLIACACRTDYINDTSYGLQAACGF